MDSYQFKFKWLNSQGQPEGFRSKKGHFDGETLVLDDVQLPAGVLMNVEFREQRMVVAFPNENGEPMHLLFQLTSGSADRLNQMLGLARSRAWAKNHKEELTKQGRGNEYRDATCPNCNAMVDLTGFPATPQVSCHFCHTMSTIDAGSFDAPQPEKNYRLCDECGMFSKPRRFTIFYFYFLLVVYGFWQKQTWRCPGCMRGEAWKMLFGNLLFVLGVPVAIVQLVRSYGGTDVGGKYPGLDSANIKARSGKFEPAIEAYRKILSKQPTSAGVKYNIALAFLHRDDYEGAAQMLEFSLADCANYEPAAQALASCYQHLGEDQKLADLKKTWGVTEEDEELDELLEE